MGEGEACGFAALDVMGLLKGVVRIEKERGEGGERREDGSGC